MTRISVFDYFLENSIALHKEAKSITFSASLDEFKKKILDEAKKLLIMLEGGPFYPHLGPHVLDSKKNMVYITNRKHGCNNLYYRKKVRKLPNDADEHCSIQLGKLRHTLSYTDPNNLRLVKHSNLYNCFLSTVIEYRLRETTGYVYTSRDGDLLCSDGKLLYIDAISIGYYDERPYSGKQVIYIPYNTNSALNCLIIGEYRLGYHFCGEKIMVMSSPRKDLILQKKFNVDPEAHYLSISDMAMTFAQALGCDNYIPSDLKEDFYETVERFKDYDHGVTCSHVIFYFG